MSDTIRIARMYGVATMQIYMFRQCNVNAKWIESTAVAIFFDGGARLACLNRIGELSKKFFNFPCTCPILDLTHEARLLAFMRDAMFQCSMSAAKYCILASESHSRAEIIRAISDVDDAIIVRIMTFEERIEFLTFANVGVAADRTIMLWSVGIDVSPKFEQTGLIPLGRVGHYLSEEVLEPFCL